MCKVIVRVKRKVYELFNSLSSLCPGEEPFYHPQGELLYSPTEYQALVLDNSSIQYSSHFDHSNISSDFPIDSDSSTDWDLPSSILGSSSLRDQEGKRERVHESFQPFKT